MVGKKETTPKKASTSKAVRVATVAPIAHGVGRRKTAVARIWLRKGKGQIRVKNKAYSEYFDTDSARLSAYEPFRVIGEAAKQFDVDVNVQGGGKIAQADAVKLGISRALVQFNDQWRSLLRQNGLLTVDSRVKERKKYGQKAARRKFQFVKR